LLTIPPATIVLVPAMWRTARPLTLVWLPWILFVIAHMIVPHKEERFMAPALPLFLVMLATALAAPPPTASAHRVVNAMGVWFVAVHVVMLGLAITYQAQAAPRRALTAIREDPSARALVAMGPEIPELYLGDRPLPVARSGNVDAVWLRRTLRDL